jgi:Domain of unknown function (DUF4328)
MSYYESPLPPQPNPYAAYPYQDSRAPRGLATASAILAGVFAVLQIGAGMAAPAAADAYARASREGVSPMDSVLTVYDAFTILQTPAMLAAYIVTCVWLTKSWNLLQERVPSSLRTRSKVWVWLGWWVPIVSLWFPYQVVRDIRRGSLGHPQGSGILAGWWACWLIYLIGYQIPSAMTTSDVPSDPSTFDALPWIEAFNTVILLIALLCWLGIIRQITRGQEELVATPAGSAPTGF